MANRKGLFTSECVSEGHPDKLCDIVSDTILDELLRNDSGSRVAVETLATTGSITIAGEVTTEAYIDIPHTVRQVVKEIGYTKTEYGFTDNCAVSVMMDTQSPDIALGVDTGGASDQGLVFGGACNDTPELMPLASVLSRALTNEYTKIRKAGLLSWARPDAKSQVTVEYDSNGKAIGIDTVVMSVQHDPEITREKLIEELMQNVITPVLNDYGYNSAETRAIHINPTGLFVIGGPMGDTGLTGRKIIVDTYGGYFSHGGGAFSGKDPTKVDRSAAYAARYVAKNIVAAGLAESCEVQISYAIGVVQPTSVYIETFGTGIEGLDDVALAKSITEYIDLSPKGIIDKFQLTKPSFKYADLAASGHFGKPNLPWEQLDLAETLKVKFNK